MILQSIGWPDRIEDRELFYHSEGTVELEPKAAAFHLSGHSVSFDTYFNLFSMAKWRKYTCLERVSLTLEVKGAVEIELLCHGLNENPLTQTLRMERLKFDDYTPVTLDYPDCEGAAALSFRVRPLSSSAALKKAAYVTDAEAVEVNLALAICTYKREDYIGANIQVLQKNIFEDPVFPLHGHVHVYIADNGQSLDADSFAGIPVTIYPNKNSGGSGGFSRAAIEALHDDAFNTTHVILMDDDISFNAWTLERNYTFLCLLRPEFTDHLLGGSMLNANHRHQLYTAGDVLTLEHVANDHLGMDLRALENVLVLADDIPCDCFGWWYCCIPASVLRAKGFSMPFFFQFDDVEFSIRCKGLPRIMLNGLCCWHYPHEHNDTDTRYYYCYRNFSVTYSLYYPEYTAEYMKQKLKKDVMYLLFTFGFRRAHLMMRGAEDFLRGVDWLISQDTATLHKEIMAAADRIQPVSELSVPFNPDAQKHKQDINQSQLRRYLRWITLNGWLLPTKRKPITVDKYLPPMQYFFRAGTVVKYDSYAQVATVARRSYREAISVLLHLRRTFKAIDKGFDRVAAEWRERHDEITSEAFWRQFLGF